jgi:aquaglyceroporin related protein
MRRGQNGEEEGKDEGVVENTKDEMQEPGSAEAIPQVGMIGDQRREEGKETPGRIRRNTEERGYGHQKIGRKRSEIVSRIGSESSAAGPYATPINERRDPMEE